jgi:hypothetical protein
MVTFPAPAVAAAWKQIELDPVSMENAFDASGRPPDVQFVESVTSFAVTHTPVLNPVEATAAVLSGVVVLLNKAALTVSADSDENVVGAAVVHNRPMIGFSIACWKMAELAPNAMSVFFLFWFRFRDRHDCLRGGEPRLRHGLRGFFLLTHR